MINQENQGEMRRQRGPWSVKKTRSPGQRGSQLLGVKIILNMEFDSRRRPAASSCLDHTPFPGGNGYLLRQGSILVCMGSLSAGKGERVDSEIPT